MKKKNILLGILLSGATIFSLASCGTKKPTNITSDPVTSTPIVTTDNPVTSTPVTDPVTGPVTTPTTTAVVEDTYVETALFNNALLRITIVDKKVDTIESLGTVYTVYKPVYINNKIAFLRALSTINNTGVYSKYYEVELNNLFDGIIFHVDDKNNFSIIENKPNSNYYAYDFTNGKGINKLTVSSDGKITKDLSTSTSEWNPIITDKTVSFSGNSYGDNINIVYNYTDTNVTFTKLRNGIEDQQFEMKKEANKLYFKLNSSYDNFDFEFDLNADGLISRGENTTIIDGITSKTVYEYSYNSNKRLVSINCPTTSQVETLEYDDKNKLTMYRFGTSKIIEYTYDNNGVLIGTKDLTSPYGNSNTIELYNDNFQVLQQLEMGGHGKHRHLYTFDSLGRQLTYIDKYYPNPDSEATYEILYEGGNAYYEDGYMEYTYQFGTGGAILYGSKHEYRVDGYKEINKYYTSTGVRDVWNITSETSYEKIDSGSIKETISYNAGVKTTRVVITETVDDDGYPLTIRRENKFDGDTEYDVYETTTSVIDVENNSTITINSKDGVLLTKTYDIKKAGIIDYELVENYVNNHIDVTTKKSYCYDADGKILAIRIETSEYSKINDEYLVLNYTDSRTDNDGNEYYLKTVEYEYNLDNRVDNETISIFKIDHLGIMQETKTYSQHSYNYISGQFHEYIWNYNVAADETKTHSYDSSLFYTSDGQVCKKLRFIYSDDTFVSEPSQTEYYMYNEDGTLRQYELETSTRTIISDYIYEDGKLVKIVTKNAITEAIVSETEVSGNTTMERTESSYMDSNDQEVINIENKYYLDLFGESVLYKVSYITEASNVELINGSNVVTSRRYVETIIQVNIYNGSSYTEEQISKLAAYPYNDGETDIEGYYQVTDRHYFEDGILKTNYREKCTLDGILISTMTAQTVRTDVDTTTSTNIEYLEDGKTPKTTEITVAEYEYGTNDQISFKKTTIDHTNNDETHTYNWNFSTGEWDLVE